MSTMGDTGRQLLGIVLGVACVFSASCATAQITTDKTLPNNSNVTINGSVFNITGGTQAGRNLFHSFQQFSVPTSSTASFNNGLDIQNIFSRVTGGIVSNIDGVIRANGTANLFLINPTGIIFGPHASLSLNGSFFASTANSLVFDNGFEFSATNPQAPPLLTVNIPIGLRFRDNPGSIQVQGDSQGIRTTSNLMDTTTGLRVQPNQTLALVGGDINLEGATLKTAGGRIELGSVAGNGLVSLTAINKGFSLGYGGVQNFGNIQLSKLAAVDASGEGGGDIQVWGRNVTLTDGSRIEASTLGSTPGGSLVVNAQNSVQLIGTSSDGQFPSALFADVYEGATGAGGNLIINTHQLSVQGGAQVSASTFGAGNSGSLNITADSIQLTGTSTDGQTRSGLFAETESGSTGDAGNLTINTHQLSVQDGARVSTSTLGEGKGGDLTINDTGQLLVQGGSQVEATTFGRGKGGSLTVSADSIQLTGTTSGLFAVADRGSTRDAGNLTINTHQLSVQGGAQVSAGTFGTGKGGNLTVTADSIQLTGTSTDGQTSSGLFAQAERGSKGDAGNLTINTHQLSVQNGALVSTSTNGGGKGGDLTINDTGQLLVQSGAQVEATTFGGGKGGSLNVTADSIQLTGATSGLFTESGSTGGDAGDLTIHTGQLLVQGGAQVEAGTFGGGKGGNLIVTADSIQLTGTSTDGQILSALFAQAERGSKGDAGDLTIHTGQLLVQGGAQVGATTFGSGKGGSLTVTADSIQLTGISTDGQFSSGLFAQADRGSTGDAGNLTINTHQLAVQDGARVSASTLGAGKGGSLTVTADSIQLTGTSTDGQTRSGLFAETESGSTGDAGTLTINTHQLAVQDGARVSAGTFGAGKGGDLTINDTGQLLVQGGAQVSASTFGAGNGGSLTVTADSIQLTGTSTDDQFPSGLFAQANPGSTGDAGNLTINTHQLAVQGGAQVEASTFGAGKGGRLNVTADSIQLTGTSTNGQFPSALFARADRGSTGDAGDLTIHTGQLLVQGGAQVSAGTFSTGKGGNLTVTANSIQLTGASSNLFTAASNGSKGDAGNLTIHTQDLTVQNGATVSVSSPQGRAGDLTITAKNIRLDLGSLTATTAVTSPNQSGANITLQGLDLLFLRNNSLISARATSNAANGGNITIDAPNGFVVAAPGGNNGSDIVASAVGGRGGNIQITAQNIYGLTPGRSIFGNGTNDIDAGSQFNQAGTVNLNTSYLNPSQTLVELPQKVIDPTTQIAQNPCQRGAGSSFSITGRGGIPYNPNQTLASDNVRVGLVTSAASPGKYKSTNGIIPSTTPTVKRLVPVQGWIFNDKGQVVLTAYDPTNTGPQRSWQKPASCARR